MHQRVRHIRLLVAALFVTGGTFVGAALVSGTQALACDPSQFLCAGLPEPWVFVGPGQVCAGTTSGDGNVFVDGFGGNTGIQNISTPLSTPTCV